MLSKPCKQIRIVDPNSDGQTESSFEKGKKYPSIECWRLSKEQSKPYANCRFVTFEDNVAIFDVW